MDTETELRKRLEVVEYDRYRLEKRIDALEAKTAGFGLLDDADPTEEHADLSFESLKQILTHEERIAALEKNNG